MFEVQFMNMSEETLKVFCALQISNYVWALLFLLWNNAYVLDEKKKKSVINDSQDFADTKMNISSHSFLRFVTHSHTSGL